MQTAGTGVRVVGDLGAELATEGLDARDVLRQVLDRDRGILDEGNGFAIPLDAHEQTQAALAHLPHVLLLPRIQSLDRAGRADLLPPEKGLRGS